MRIPHTQAAPSIQRCPDVPVRESTVWGGDLTPHVPPALRHDDINSAGGRPPRLFSAADRLQDDPVGLVDFLDALADAGRSTTSYDSYEVGVD
jgi:hypothetical protein